jgi:hypothetical protein
MSALDQMLAENLRIEKELRAGVKACADRMDTLTAERDALAVALHDCIRGLQKHGVEPGTVARAKAAIDLVVHDQIEAGVLG